MRPDHSLQRLSGCLVHLVYCESGIETFCKFTFLLICKSVHLVYCESGIETFCKFTFLLICKSVHLVYCESGIETRQYLQKKRKMKGSFSLLRERY